MTCPRESVAELEIEFLTPFVLSFEYKTILSSPDWHIHSTSEENQTNKVSLSELANGAAIR